MKYKVANNSVSKKVKSKTKIVVVNLERFIAVVYFLMEKKCRKKINERQYYKNTWRTHDRNEKNVRLEIKRLTIYTWLLALNNINERFR